MIIVQTCPQFSCFKITFMDENGIYGNYGPGNVCVEPLCPMKQDYDSAKIVTLKQGIITQVNLTWQDLNLVV